MGKSGAQGHGKLWTWWSPYVDAAIFKGLVEEGEMLMAADPETFVLQDHYASHSLIFVAGGWIDQDWAR
ncbi:hypothetical protein [Actibacterium sp. 188UL27-1]|uniref:hypothetical protein n=1 Tax=Actibacterium sp. 188UL27-1 TaxID=2786961 RepID=UPI00195DC777|nr:hypothetical protein [Actibacterium sp. 188UL27-1]MBM7066259.1 hypothetical protein [Actibacterium sp. 188UL27-1]